MESHPYPLPQRRERKEIFSPGCGECRAADFRSGVPNIRRHEGITGLALVVFQQNVVQHGTTETRATESRRLFEGQYQGVPLLFLLNF